MSKELEKCLMTQMLEVRNRKILKALSGCKPGQVIQALLREELRSDGQTGILTTAQLLVHRNILLLL